MAYSSSNLSVLAYANHFTLWHFTATDAPSTVEKSGYFNPASGLVRVNDVIIANLDTDGEPRTVFYIVNENTQGEEGYNVKVVRFAA